MPAMIEAYVLLVSGTGRGIRRGGTGQMGEFSRLHHDLEVAQKATLALMVGIVMATFLALAFGAAIYDIGDWLAIW